MVVDFLSKLLGKGFGFVIDACLAGKRSQPLRALPSISSCVAKLQLPRHDFSARLPVTCDARLPASEWQRRIAAGSPNTASLVGPAAREPGQSESPGVHVLRPLLWPMLP